LHHTVRGREVALDPQLAADGATGQFEIADERTAGEMAQVLRAQGLEAVWKDWDAAILAS